MTLDEYIDVVHKAFPGNSKNDIILTPLGVRGMLKALAALGLIQIDEKKEKPNE